MSVRESGKLAFVAWCGMLVGVCLLLAAAPPWVFAIGVLAWLVYYDAVLR